MKEINKTTLFLILTFGISYSLAGIYFLLGGKYDKVSGTVLAVVYMFIPMASALIIEKGVHKEKIKERLHISFRINKWFFVAWFITPVLSFLTLGISLLFPDVSYSPEMSGMIERFEDTLSPEQLEQMKNSVETLPMHPLWISVLQGLVAGATVNAVAGFGEELGWRGFLLKQLSGYSFVKISLLIGFIWGIWHAPLILMGHNFPDHPEAGVLLMTIWCILLSPLFIYITIKSGSVIAASIMHGTLNATAGIAIMVIDGGSDLTVGVTGLSGFIALLIVLAGFFIYDQWIRNEKLMSQKQISW